MQRTKTIACAQRGSGGRAAASRLRVFWRSSRLRFPFASFALDQTDVFTAGHGACGARSRASVLNRATAPWNVEPVLDATAHRIPERPRSRCRNCGVRRAEIAGARRGVPDQHICFRALNGACQSCNSAARPISRCRQQTASSWNRASRAADECRRQSPRCG